VSEYLNLAEMRATIGEWLAEQNEQLDGDIEAVALLEALGIPRLLRDVEIAARVVVAADGFHPVARFFADGSDEHRFIVGVLHGLPV
jgi:hypothetical protein